MKTRLQWRNLLLTLSIALCAFGLTIASGQMAADAAVATATPLPTPAIDPADAPPGDLSPVWAVVEANGRYYVGGNFQTVAGDTQPYLAAIDVATGRLDQNFRPLVNDEVLSLAISPDGSSLYVGGRFSKVDDSYPLRLAKLDAVTGAVDTNFAPKPSAAVEKIVTDGTSVWVGGNFATIGGVAQPHLAKLDTAGVVDTAFDTAVESGVLDVELAGNRLYFSGTFETVDGEPHGRLAAVDAATGDLEPWAPQSAFKIYDLSLKPTGDLIYSAGGGSRGAGGNSLIAWDTTTGEQVWRRINAGDFQAVVATDELVYIGTHGDYVFDSNDGPFMETDENPNAIPRAKLAAFDPVTGALDPWAPVANSTWGVWSLSLGPSGLLVGGDFTQIGGDAHSHFAVFPGPSTGNQSPAPAFSYSCNDAGACTFDASGSSDPDGSVASYAWDFGDGRTATGVTTSAVFAADAQPMVALTISDDGGATARTQNVILVGDGLLAVELVEASSANSSATATLTIPADASNGDIAIAIVTVNNDTATITPPAGWTEVESVVGASMVSTVYRKPVVTAEAGTPAAFSVDGASYKIASKLLTFRHADPAAPILATSLVETMSTTQHAAPAITTTAPGAVIHYWAERSATGTSLAAPSDEATLLGSTGSGGGHITDVVSLAVEPNPGTTPAAFAVGELATRSALGWSIAVTGLPQTPTCVATAIDGVVMLEWFGVRDADTFTVRRDGGWVATGTFMSYADSPAPGVYSYEIRATIPGARVDIPCAPVTIEEPAPPPAQTCTAVLNADGTITLSWDAIDGEDGYNLRRNGSWYRFEGDALSAIDDPGAGTWDYVIQSRMNGTTTLTSCAGGPITIELPVAPAQTCTAVLNADDTISLTWDAIPGENGYGVRRNGSFLTFAGAQLSFVDDPGVGTWDYVIRSKMDGVTTNTTCDGGPIVIDDASPPPPASQSCTTTVNADGTVTLVWDEIAGEDRYIVRRNDSWLSNTGALSYTDTFAQPGDTYVVRSRQGDTVTNTPCA